MDFSNWIFWFIVLPYIVVLGKVSRIFSGGSASENISKWGLSVLSCVLLAVISVETLLIFLFVSLLAYVVCRASLQASRRGKTIVLALLIPVLLLPLIYYKYADFVASDVLGRKWDTFHDLVIPVGISFYSFQIVSFCVDTLRSNQRIPKFVDYMNFCSFFPQMVAGPIERRENLLPQMESWRANLKGSNLADGLPYIILGLFFKLTLADNLASAMAIGYCGENAFQIWINNVAFGFRIYFDFAGYGLSAYGVARCLGVHIIMNFMSPYTSCNVTEFWRKWHISLTHWFRDYIYFSLGGSRTRFWWFNIIFMFLVSGVWHGAGWNFIIWGGLAGVTMVIHRLFRNMQKKLPPMIGWGLTFGVMMFIWMFFYETDMTIIRKNFCAIVDWHNYDFIEFLNSMYIEKRKAAMLCLFLTLSFFAILIEYISLRRTPENPYRLHISPIGCGIMTFLMVVLHNSIQNSFIYFAF